MKHDWRRLRTGWTPSTHRPTPAAPPLPPPPPPSQSILTQPPPSVGSCLTCALLRSSPQPPFSTTFCPTESCCCTLVKTHRIRGATISQTCSLLSEKNYSLAQKVLLSYVKLKFHPGLCFVFSGVVMYPIGLRILLKLNSGSL